MCLRDRRRSGCARRPSTPGRPDMCPMRRVGSLGRSTRRERCTRNLRKVAAGRFARASSRLSMLIHEAGLTARTSVSSSPSAGSLRLHSISRRPRPVASVMTPVRLALREGLRARRAEGRLVAARHLPAREPHRPPRAARPHGQTDRSCLLPRVSEVLVCRRHRSFRRIPPEAHLFGYRRCMSTTRPPAEGITFEWLSEVARSTAPRSTPVSASASFRHVAGETSI